MSYEQHCNDYALHGDPMRDAYEYELMAEYDRWDGHRMENDYDCEDWYYDQLELEERREFAAACNEDIADYLESL